MSLSSGNMAWVDLGSIDADRICMVAKVELHVAVRESLYMGVNYLECPSLEQVLEQGLGIGS